jgi:hypothetical protein
MSLTVRATPAADVLAPGQDVTYHGSYWALHGPYTVLRHCDCAAHSHDGAPRYILGLLPGAPGAGILDHVRRSSITPAEGWEPAPLASEGRHAGGQTDAEMVLEDRWRDSCS